MPIQIGWKRLAVSALPALLASFAMAQPASDAAVVKEFENRVEKYLEIHKNSNVNQKPTDSPEKLAGQKQQTEQKMRESRPAAKQGDIFAPGIGAYFKKQIAVTLNGPDGAKVRASLKRAEPLPDVPLQVNRPYPRNLPLQSTPPTLLLNLPQLPSGLQYRIVGSKLVLYDTASNLIVDFLPDAMPKS